jgi:hypothetical protein
MLGCRDQLRDEISPRQPLVRNPRPMSGRYDRHQGDTGRRFPGDRALIRRLLWSIAA